MADKPKRRWRRPTQDCGNFGWCGFEDRQKCHRHALSPTELEKDQPRAK